MIGQTQGRGLITEKLGDYGMSLPSVSPTPVTHFHLTLLAGNGQEIQP